MSRGKKKTATKKKAAKKKAGKALATKSQSSAMVSTDQADRLAAMAAEQAGLETAAGGKNIKVKDSGFEFNGEKMDNPFEASVLDYRFENTYYDGPYVEGETTPPACFAIGKIEADLKPHPDSPDKQADRCADCWANEYGTHPQGGKGKACSNKRRLALLPVPEDGPLDDLEPAFMKVSPTSLANWKGFVKKVTEALGKPTLAVVCEIEREDKVTDFTYIDDLGDEDIAACLMHHDAVQSDLDAPYDVSGYEAGESKGKGKGKRIPAKKKSSKKKTKKQAKKKARRAA